ncbi:hypothetical protein [Hymenobacter sp. BRD67]|uniref:hypothetical protein n=1 Tax=Hymenobacter sp. BRD67 TaxID=2675877 RepID=UPI0015636F0B|nr:hypothetical protein [Hymenobacter sp. BRD67]QKG51785.1 hypothetical protein GKZ67_03205 [Hymenobacter sp. BRD67]
MDTSSPSLSASDQGPANPAATPTCEAFAVKIGYIWLMVLAPVAGFVIGLVSLTAAPNAGVLALALALLAIGYLAWRRGYRAVRLELRPESLHIQPAAAGQPAQELPLARIANYLRPQEAYYQILELQLHGGTQLRFGKRLREPTAGLLSLDDWTEALVSRLELARPAVAPGAAASVPGTAALASGLAAERPRIFARTTFGKVLAGLAIVWMLLALLVLLDPSQPGPAAWVFVVPSLYMGYYFRARGSLKGIKVQTKFLTGIQADRDNWNDND